MPNLDLVTATTSVPAALPEIVAVVDDDLPAGLRIDDASSVTPDILNNITVAKMEPKIAAGIELAKYVLLITFVSIGILSAYLSVMEYNIGSDIKSAYTQILTANRPGNEIYVLSSIDRMISDIQDLAKNESATRSP